MSDKQPMDRDVVRRRPRDELYHELADFETRVFELEVALNALTKCNAKQQERLEQITERRANAVAIIEQKRERIYELEAAFAKQNAQDPELMDKVAGFANAEHGLTVDMDDGTGRTGLYIETGFLRNLLAERDELRTQVRPSITRMHAEANARADAAEAALKKAGCPCCDAYHFPAGDSLVARLAKLEGECEVLRANAIADGVTIERLRGLLQPYEHALPIAREQRDEMEAHADALECDNAKLREAIGLATTAIPSMEMDAANPVGMMQLVVAEMEHLQRDKCTGPDCGKPSQAEVANANLQYICDKYEIRLGRDMEHRPDIAEPEVPTLIAERDRLAAVVEEVRGLKHYCVSNRDGDTYQLDSGQFVLANKLDAALASTTAPQQCSGCAELRRVVKRVRAKIEIAMGCAIDDTDGNLLMDRGDVLRLNEALAMIAVLKETDNGN